MRQILDHCARDVEAAQSKRDEIIVVSHYGKKFPALVSSNIFGSNENTQQQFNEGSTYFQRIRQVQLDLCREENACVSKDNSLSSKKRKREAKKNNSAETKKKPVPTKSAGKA